MTCIGAVKGRYGNILYWNRDIVIATNIAAYGEWFESEVDVFRMYVKPGDAVIDCGANIGAHTMALAHIVGPVGAVVAIEPQRPIFQVMCANAILNGYMNVHPVLAAAGATRERKTFIEPDYTLPNSFGGYETTARAVTHVGARTRIDRLDALVDGAIGERPVSFIKVDVEGSEEVALRGAVGIMARDRPVLYVENDRREHSEDLIRFVRAEGYDPHWHVARFYNPANLAGRADDIPMNRYGWVGGKINGASLMLLCLPVERRLPAPEGARRIGAADEYPPFGDEP